MAICIGLTLPNPKYTNVRIAKNIRCCCLPKVSSRNCKYVGRFSIDDVVTMERVRASKSD